MTPLVLGVLAVLLAGPVPAVLSRVTRLHRTPLVSMLLWQCLALAAVLAAIGAGLALVSYHDSNHGPAWLPVAVAALSLAIAVTVLVRLVVSGHRVGTNLRALRRRHREHVDLLAAIDEAGGYRVIDHDVPVAYCLPGVGSSRIVLSAAARDRLAQSELDAVLAHERAHLRARHDLVVEAFTVLHQAFPRFVSSRAALAQVQLLAEILADRAAVEVAGQRALYQALLTMSAGRTPHGALGAGGDLQARVSAVQQAGSHPVQSTVVAGAGLALLILPTWLVVYPWFPFWIEFWSDLLGL